jgi:hypothetical protein
MKKPNLAAILLISVFALKAETAHADVVWPALYVADSHFRFWYVVIIGLILEAGVLRWRLIPDTKKAILVSLVVNAISATVGVYILAFGMLGWHLIVDNFVQGTFAAINQIATIVIMLIGSAFLEVLAARAIWKYPLRQTFPVFILGNILSYGVVVADLYFFGGWNKSF